MQPNLTQKIQNDINALASDISVLEEQLKSGKYAYISYADPRWGSFSTKSASFDASVHEYVTHAGEVGWVLLIKYTDETGVYIKKIGSGPLAASYSSDWVKQD